ncbi:uncharacterized protein YehS (DUF1456 family) [Bacillus sp. SORGH_AS 510]|uniref:DUF1456 family protein n=1 Tax=Bacillus sp. SORGH_AS_0510 TaxID=3041771 RepID=UPI002788629E|nr:DUF1456 family protein [Bacillus sp. SORGH_AS_0510]MDQ1147900.1 uncharacterized protein YehS (DUF1456 family) [Bacillus sp. SORGH_AS_0510]
MENNDILVRLRYALDIKDTDMVQIFKLGEVEVTKDEVRMILTKSSEDEDMDSEYVTKCNNKMLESFLNGFIIFKRGRQETKPGQPEKPAFSKESVNNILLKKVKIALSLTSEDIIDILASAGVTITKGELSALLRKEGHKNYKECGDKYARNFLKGLAIRYRG